MKVVRDVARDQGRHPARLDVGGGRAADEWREYLVRLAERPMARRALVVPYLLALLHAARSRRQALEVRPHVDVPGLDLGGRGGAADAGELGPGPLLLRSGR